MGSRTRTLSRAAVVGLVFAWVAGVAVMADGPWANQAASPSPDSLDGAYTEAQAKRGKQVSSEQCAACHGDDLGGAGMAPGLAGESFLALWDGRSVADLYERIRTTMPAHAPGSLTNEQYIDVVAFVLQANNIRPGEKELQATAPELKSMMLRRSR